MSLTPSENPSRIPPRPFPPRNKPFLIATKRNQNMLQLVENKQRQPVLIATNDDMRFSHFGPGFCSAGTLPALFLRKFATVYLGTPASPLALFLRSCAPGRTDCKAGEQQIPRPSVAADSLGMTTRRSGIWDEVNYRTDMMHLPRRSDGRSRTSRNLSDRPSSTAAAAGI